MKKRQLIYTCFTLLLLTASSCENLLEVDIPQNQISSGSVFENTQTANAALAALYAGLYDNSPLAGDQTGRLMGIYADDLDFYSPTATNGVLELSQNVQIDSNPAILTYWTNAYQKVYIANSIIAGIDQSTGIAAADKKRMKGEALLVRSILFYFLEEIFGDIPYPETTSYILNQSLPKTAAAEVLQRLKRDILESDVLLADAYPNAERIYPNRQVARLLLAKVYLSQADWGRAETLLKQIIQNPMYPFQNDVTKVFNKTGSHILWQLKPKNSGDGTKESSLYYFNNGAPASYALSQSLMSTFSSTDLRKQHWTAAVTANGNTWYRSDKYKNRTNNTSEYSVIFRIEEAYLLLAETLMQQNKLDDALPYINATRTRAGLAPLQQPITQEALKTEIVTEYRREFFTEMGHRFFDLKRMNRLPDLFSTKPNWKTGHQLWPLPQKELLLNPNLKPQNQGY